MSKINQALELLATRISIVMVREGSTFLTPLKEFQYNLKKYFKYEYTEDEIENELHRMEEAYICNQADEEEQFRVMSLGEIEEDF